MDRWRQWRRRVVSVVVSGRTVLMRRSHMFDLFSLGFLRSLRADLLVLWALVVVVVVIVAVVCDLR
jgi:hypothetical protein